MKSPRGEAASTCSTVDVWSHPGSRTLNPPQAVLASLAEGDPVLLERERDNSADPNAVAIRTLAGKKAGA